MRQMMAYTEGGELDRRLPPITAIDQMDRGQSFIMSFSEISTDHREQRRERWSSTR